jgi:hypothetical protein
MIQSAIFPILLELKWKEVKKIIIIKFIRNLNLFLDKLIRNRYYLIKN